MVAILEIIKVGVYRKGKGKYTYKDVSFDANGWADVERFLPITFDLCLLKSKDRIFTGWFNGMTWDGLRMKPNDVVLYWKRKLDELA